jgi:hypothetical protein
MSALPPKADIRPRDQDVCFGPKADIGTNLACQLFDHLVDAAKLLTKDEARRTAANIAKLPELLRKL